MTAVPASVAPLALATLLLWGGPSAVAGQESMAPRPDPVQAPQMVQVEVASVGVDLATSAPLALLHSDWENVLPIWIGDGEAVAIARALQGVTPPRPMTHDLLVGVMETLGGTLEEVRITEIRDATFFGVLRIRTAGGIREVDTRPSDALALAVRTGARIGVASELLDDIPEVEFLSAEGGSPIVRVRGVTVGVGDPSASRQSEAGVRVLHAAPEVEARGLRRGDLVIRVQGRTTRQPLDFLEAVRDRQGGAVEVTRLRDGEEGTVQIPPRRVPARTGE